MTARTISLCLLALARLNADVAPSNLFGDHMVLQRGMPVAVWGTAAPGEAVTVRFAGNTRSAKADEAGRWTLDLPALDASAVGREMIIEGSNRIVIRDVLVGEVWICSGQSNMQYGWGSKANALHNWGNVPAIEAMAADAKTKPIRSFTVPVNVSFAPTKECKGEWSTDVSGSAVAFGFSYHLHEALKVPVAVIVTCWGSSSIEGWMPLDMTGQLPHFKTIMEQFEADLVIKQRVQAAIDRGVSPGNVFVRKQPNLLYNAMLHPLIPYSCRGMVWYQGEANADKPDLYAQSLPLWIKCLRKAWGRDDFHFLAVMLPGFGTDDGRPDGKSWAWFREAQMKAMDLPHTGVANTIDLGDAKEIHPADKAPITQRLALLARRDVMGEEIVAQGPVFKSMAVDGTRTVIGFSHAMGLKTTDGNAPRGFWLSGKEGVWHSATASIRDYSVVLESSDVANPVACRYAFSGKPDVNLVNREGLPAYPFRTDG